MCCNFLPAFIISADSASLLKWWRNGTSWRLSKVLTSFKKTLVASRAVCHIFSTETFVSFTVCETYYTVKVHSSQERETESGKRGGGGYLLASVSLFLIHIFNPINAPIIPFFPNLLSRLFISPSLSLHLLSIFSFWFPQSVQNSPLLPHSSTSFIFPMFALRTSAPIPILQLQSVSMSLGVNRSSIKANLNFIHSDTREFIIKRGEEIASVSFTTYSCLFPLTFFFLCVLSIALVHTHYTIATVSCYWRALCQKAGLLDFMLAWTLNLGQDFATSMSCFYDSNMAQKIRFSWTHKQTFPSIRDIFK